MPDRKKRIIFRRTPSTAEDPNSRLGHFMWACGGRNGVWLGFPRSFSRFPYHKFHFIIYQHSSHPFGLISLAPVMLQQAWSAGTLSIH